VSTRKDAAAHRKAIQLRDAQAMSEVGLSPKPGDYPLTVAQLARAIIALQRRVERLETTRGRQS